MTELKFSAGFEKLIKDREGEVKLTFQIPLSDMPIVMNIPHQALLNINISYDESINNG